MKDLKRWEAACLGEAIDLTDFKKAEVDTRRASVEQELTRLDDQQRLIEQAELEISSLMAYCERVRAELQTFNMEEKRRALEALDIAVIWHPGELPEIHGSISMAIVSNAAHTGAWCCLQKETRYGKRNIIHLRWLRARDVQ